MDIWKAITEVVCDQSEDRVLDICDKIEKKINPDDPTEDQVRKMKKIYDAQSMTDLASAWEAHPQMGIIALVNCLRAASKTATVLDSRESVEMVWTGPFTDIIPSRHTEQIFIDVIESAKRSLFIISYATYKYEPLESAIEFAIRNGATVKILLESSKDQGGRLEPDSISRYRKLFPSALLYSWDGKIDNNQSYPGCVHAKCAVADSEKAIITSANLTGAAMEKNMELGTLITGGRVPEQLNDHLEALITTGKINSVMS